MTRSAPTLEDLGAGEDISAQVIKRPRRTRGRGRFIRRWDHESDDADRQSQRPGNRPRGVYRPEKEEEMTIPETIETERPHLKLTDDELLAEM